MSRVRKSLSVDYKAQLAMAAIGEDATIADPSSRYGIHATVIRRWKKEAIAALTAGFSGKQERQESDQAIKIKKLDDKIGQLIVKRNF
jgi:transposase